MSVELQLSHQRGMWRRMEYYNSRLYVDQLSEGAEYSDLNRVITIVLSQPILLPREKGYHFKFSRYDPVAQVMFPGSSEIHVLEFQKVLQTDDSALGVWLRFFAATTVEEFEMVAKIRPEVAKAWAVIKHLSADEEARRLADAEEKHRRDAVDREEGARDEGVETGRKEGIEIGREEGIEEGIEIGRKEGRMESLEETVLQLLRRKMSYEEIADITRLSVDEIRRLENGSQSQ